MLLARMSLNTCPLLHNRRPRRNKLKSVTHTSRRLAEITIQFVSPRDHMGETLKSSAAIADPCNVLRTYQITHSHSRRTGKSPGMCVAISWPPESRGDVCHGLVSRVLAPAPEAQGRSRWTELHRRAASINYHPTPKRSQTRTGPDARSSHATHLAIENSLRLTRTESEGPW